VTGLVAFAVALGTGLVLAFLVHLLFGGVGQPGFRAPNPGGLLEGAAFVLGLSGALLVARRALRLPSAVVLSLGLVVPPTAARAAQGVADLEWRSGGGAGWSEGVSVVRQDGRPVGLHDPSRDRTTAWDEVPRVPGGVAVTELRGSLARSPLVVVADGDDVYGIITREMFLAGLWDEA
jgi:hypothetical protein